jgi:DNA-directed RNA polymerase specialized sigma24 family protein
LVDVKTWMASEPLAAATIVATPDAAATMDEQAFHACYRRTAGPLRAYVVRVMGSVAVADDMVQEAYLRLLRVERPPDDPAAQRALLIRIASNLMIDHWRRVRRERSDGAEPAERMAADPDLALRLDMEHVSKAPATRRSARRSVFARAASACCCIARSESSPRCSAKPVWRGIVARLERSDVGTTARP